MCVCMCEYECLCEGEREKLHIAQNKEKKKKNLKCHYIHSNNIIFTSCQSPTGSPPKHIGHAKLLPQSFSSHTDPRLLKTQLFTGSGHVEMEQILATTLYTHHKRRPITWHGGEGDPSVQKVERNPATATPAEPRQRVAVQVLAWRVLTLSLLSVDGTNTLHLFFFFSPPLKIKKQFMSWSRASKNE